MSKTREEVHKDGELATLKVAAASDVGKVAGAIAKFMNEGAKVELWAIGAGAVNQTVKAIAVARGMAAASGRNLYCIPSFQNETPGVGLSVKTAIKFAIFDLKLH